MSIFASFLFFVTWNTIMPNLVKAQQNPLALLENSVARTTNQSLFWGTYRPNLYFGTRARLPESLLTGLMWFGVDDSTKWQHIRHACDQGDDMAEYSYKKHNGRSFAMQTLTDEENNVTLKTEFLKVLGGDNGGNWGVRISGIPTNQGKSSRLSLLYYIGLQGEGSLELNNKLTSEGLSDPILLKGDSPELGRFSIEINDGPNNKIPSTIPSEVNPIPDLHKTQYWGHLVPDDDMWRAKEYVSGQISLNVENKLAENSTRPLPYWLTLRNTVREDSNFFVFQKIVEAPFQFDIYFNSDSSPTNLDASRLTSGLESSSRDFDERFERTFGLLKKGFNIKQIRIAKLSLSNLIGGIGYFYGSSIVDRSYTSEVDEDEINFWDRVPEPEPRLTPPAVLFTATPSRPFFPRGFYWDEGFHQLLIGEWDNDLSLDIIRHWTSLIDSDGWVAREQILGEEARSKVPARFQTQYPHYANPPMILMPIKAFLERLAKHKNVEHISNDDETEEHNLDINNFVSTTDPALLPDRHLIDKRLSKAFLQRVYVKIKSNYRWFKRTQRGEIKAWGRHATNGKEAYRWRGRTPGHTLTSGLDDYPRPTPPHPAELHVDLISWVGFMARTLKDIALALNEDDDAEDYEDDYNNIVANLQDLHWSENDKAFCDLSVNENDESVFVCHKGYISIYPMLLNLLPNDSPKLGAILDLIENPEELWSPYGLRSLSKSDEFFNTGENYWRGPVWININYLTLSCLFKNYAVVPGPYQTRAQKLYRELREIIINNTVEQYGRSGFLWEQYSAINGEGLRSHPFTGWTALITLIMAEIY
ncbi:hypothetical protein G9A89_017326 [Geosiphon pyriformis]|nr:hypothetical protein G9A89_017326 [Geosiphon pyriformis]